MVKPRAKFIAVAAFLGLLLTTAHVSAQTYSRTESIAYHDNTAKWVLGQTASITCIDSIPASSVCDGDDVQFATTFDPANALPLTHSAFGKLQQTLTYNVDGTVATVKDGNNNVVALSSWKRGIPQSIKYPATAESPSGATKSASVNDNGWLSSVTDENGYKTCYAYDTMGRISRITYPSETSVGVCDASTWNEEVFSFVPTTAQFGIPSGHWAQVHTRGSYRKITHFDALWRPIFVQEEGEPGTVRYKSHAYDQSGRTIFSSYPVGSASAITDLTKGVWTGYDALGRVTSVSQDSEIGLLTTLTEYLPGLMTRVTNPRGQQTLTIYQAFDHPTYEFPAGISELGGDRHTEIYRDVFGKVTALRRRNGDASTQVWRHYVYDAHQQLCKTVEPETGATIMDYDGAGNLQWSASGLHHLMGITGCDTIAARDSGRKVTRTYDGRNRLHQLLFPNGVGDQLWSYTPDSLPSQVTTWNETGGHAAIVNDYVYNRRRMLTGESIHLPNWYVWGLGYGYDANGSLASQTYPTGLAITYAPNALGQATQARDQSGYYYASGAIYYPNGAIKQFTYGNGIVHSMSQNARQLPLVTADSSGTHRLQYSYDENGNVNNIYDLDTPSKNRYLSYDGLDRLTAAGSQVFGGDHWHRFTYDALDNITSWKLAGVKEHTYVYDAQNRLGNLKNPDGSTVVGFGYDLQGNLANKNGRPYTFDFGNRLREAYGPTGATGGGRVVPL